MTEDVQTPQDVELLETMAPVPGQMVDVVAAPRPFSTDRVMRSLREGMTLAEIMVELGIPTWAHARVFIDDWLVPRKWWPYVKPKRGRRVTIRVIPTGGGGGGGDSNKTWRILLQVVVLLVIVVLTVLTYGATGWLFYVYAAATVAVGVGGPLLINALFPIPPPTLPKLSGSGFAESPTLTLTGARNQANIYGPVPRVFGTHRMFPPYGTQPFTELAGDNQFLRMLFVVGYGPLEITDLRIGDTPIDQFQGVEVEIRPGLPDDLPISLFPQRVHEGSQSILLSFENSWQVRTTGVGVDEISVEVTFPQGLIAISNRGTRFGWTVMVDIQYAPLPADNAPILEGDWIPLSALECSASTNSTVFRGFRWTVPRGQYAVRLRRTTPTTTGLDQGALLSLFVSLGRFDLVNAIEDTQGVGIQDITFWSVLRTFINADPVALPGLAKVAFRIKATDQLHGTIDSFNCVVTAILPEWDVSTQTWIERPTQSPAAAYRRVLQGRENQEAVADARIELSSLQQWAEACAGWGFTFNHVVDYETTTFELLRLIASAARAGFAMFDDRYGVVFERVQTVPVQYFTPRNSREFKGLKNFPDPVHAVKVHFINPDKSWQQDERIVYDDGYNADGSGGLVAATLFATIDLIGTTDPEQAYRQGRYHLAQARLRPEVYELVADIENLVCTRGDLVQVAHDVPFWGLGWGRVARVRFTEDGTLMTGLTLDELFPMEAGKSYTIRVRDHEGGGRILPVATSPGEVRTLTLDPPAALPAVQPGNLVMFGETGRESVQLIVRMINPMQDFQARLQLVDAAFNILEADTGPVPPWDSQVTLPPIIERFPPIPQVDNLRSDESVLIVGADGTVFNRILVTLRPASGLIPVEFLEVRARETGTTTWRVLSNVAGDATEVYIDDVEEGRHYDLRLRAATTHGLRSDWREILDYAVIGKSNPPPDVVGLLLLGSALTWSYPNAPIDLAGFVLRQIAGSEMRWEDGLGMHGGIISATTSFELPPLSGLRTLMVKAKDTVGNESLNAASLTVDFGAPSLHNIVESRDEHAFGFPGTRVNAGVSGFTGHLEAAQVPALFWSQPTARFWTNPAALFWSSPYEEMIYSWTYVTGALADGTTLVIDLAAQGSARIEYKRSSETAWLPFPGVVPGITALTSYDFRVTIAASPLQGIIETLVLYLDAPDLTESFQDVPVAVTTGSRLALTQSYRMIKTVQVTVQAFGGETAITARTQDKDAALGPLVQALDTSGAVVAGHIDAQLVGY